LEEKRQEKAEKAETKIISNTNQAPKEKKKLTYSEQQEFKKLEKEIIKLETRKEEITAEFSNPNLDGEAIEKLSREIQEIENKLEVKEERWMDLSEFV